MSKKNLIKFKIKEIQVLKDGEWQKVEQDHLISTIHAYEKIYGIRLVSIDHNSELGYDTIVVEGNEKSFHDLIVNAGESSTYKIKIA